MTDHFTIDRAVWLRGEGPYQGSGSYLLRQEDGKRCCVGIYLQACGVPDRELEDMSIVAELEDTSIPAGAQWLLEGEWGPRELYIANDSADVSESDIAARFAAHGITVTFEGEDK